MSPMERRLRPRKQRTTNVQLLLSHNSVSKQLIEVSFSGSQPTAQDVNDALQQDNSANSDVVVHGDVCLIQVGAQYVCKIMKKPAKGTRDTSQGPAELGQGAAHVTASQQTINVYFDEATGKKSVTASCLLERAAQIQIINRSVLDSNVQGSVNIGSSEPTETFRKKLREATDRFMEKVKTLVQHDHEAFSVDLDQVYELGKSACEMDSENNRLYEAFMEELLGDYYRSAKLDARLDRVDSELKSRIDRVESELISRIDGVGNEVKASMENLTNMIGTLIARQPFKIENRE